MGRIFVVADDVTGSNATGALFGRLGLTAATVWDPSQIAPQWESFDVVALSTGTRDEEPDTAAGVLRRALESVPPAALVVKRIDSTLRGNIGPELEAVLQSLRHRLDDVRALVVSAFPAADRTCRHGIQYVNDLPLDDVVLTGGPTPRRSNRVAEVVAAGSTLDVHEASLGHDLEDFIETKADAVVCDATSDDDLDDIAKRAAQLARRTGVTFVSVDPGPFGPRLAHSLGLAERQRSLEGTTEGLRGPVVVVAGSPTDTTISQLDIAVDELGARLVHFEIGATTEEELESRLGELAGNAGDTAIFGVRTAAAAAHRVELDRDVTGKVNTALAGAVASVARARTLGGLYLTGGEVSEAVVKALGARAVVVVEEIVPLAVGGTMIGGICDGVPVVTKGGLVGDEDAAVVCLQRLTGT